MNERPTPETDAEHAQFAMGGFTLDFCRKLERERDEARESIVGWENKWKCAVEMAAQAEVERDEAWACCDELVVDSNAITLAKTVMRLERERDEAIADRDIARLSALESDRAHDRMVAELEKVYKERDEAREAAAKWESSSDGMERAGAEQARRADENREWALRAERERDEARDILRKLLEIIPEPECHDFGHTKEEQHAFLEKCPVMERYDALIAQAKDVAK